MNTTNIFYCKKVKPNFEKRSDYILKTGSFFSSNGEKSLYQHPSLNLFSTKNTDRCK